MLQDLALALRLQALDRKLSALEREISILPKHIAEIETKLETHSRRLEAAKASQTSNQRERKKLEGDIQVQEQKISKLKGQTLEAKTNEQYKAFQNEIGYCEGEIRKAEDKILELMEQAEPLDKSIRAAEAELKTQQHVESEKKRVLERTAADRRELAARQSDRKSAIAEINPKLYADYERIRRKTKGTAIADGTDGRCDACQIVLRPQFFQDLRRGDQIMFCESCGRILTYNPVVELDPGLEAAHRHKT